MLLQALSQVGFEAVARRYLRSFTAPDHGIDFSGGSPATWLQARLNTATGLAPTWVLVGFLRADDWSRAVPVKYGEKLSLRLKRGNYQVVAWFFSVAADGRTPMLEGIATDTVMVISNRPQRIQLTGHVAQPTAIDEIYRAAPDGLPFNVPFSPARRELLPGTGTESNPHLEIISIGTCDARVNGGPCRLPIEEEGRCARHRAGADSLEIIAWSGRDDSPFFGQAGDL